MAIKAIQLRGISRTPSDRMTQDGGLAESLNLFVDDTETATMPTPEDVTETAEDGYGHKLFPSDTTTVPENPERWEAVFIHKSPYFTRAIVKYQGEHHEPEEDDNAAHIGSNTIYDELVEGDASQEEEPVIVTKIGWVNDGVVVELMEIADGDEFVKCSAFGNTLGVITKISVFWFLCKDGNYKSLGSSIPFPKFTLAAKMSEQDYKEAPISGDSEHPHVHGESHDDYPYNNTITYQEVLSRLSTWGGGQVIGQPLENLRSFLREEEAPVYSSFSSPRFAILAVELVDGTSYVSSPILLGRGFVLRYIFEGNMSVENTGASANAYVKYDSYHGVQVKKWKYIPWLKIEEDYDFFNEWMDIVKKVRVYMSTNVSYFYDKVKIPNIASNEIQYYAYGGHNPTDLINSAHGGFMEYPYSRLSHEVLINTDTNEEAELLSKSQFYLAASFDIDDKEEIREIFNGKLLDLSSTKTTSETPVSVMTDELLVAQPALDFSKADMKHYKISFKNSVSFNNHNIVHNISEETAFDLPCLTVTRYYGDPREYININGITFHFQEANGKWHAIKAMFNGNDDPCGFKTNIDGQEYNNMQYGFIICPDARCKYADVSFYDSALDDYWTLRIDFKEHPYLDCSYWYGDVNKKIKEFELSRDEYNPGNRSETCPVPNKVYASGLDNPFVFPIDKRYTFTGKVLGASVATTALSTGQFGQFPLYIFTDDGIWALEVNSEGDFVTSKPLSREVCINPDSITPIDNAVVFVTEKGVMMISGSQVTNISPNMNGQHFHLEPSSTEWQLIEGSDWADILESVGDDTHFMEFMRSAFIVYDYAGERLVFFKEDEVYQYVYYIKSSTWHKMARPIVIPAAQTAAAASEAAEESEEVEVSDTPAESQEEQQDEEETAALSYRYPLSDYPYSYVNIVGGEEGTRILKVSTKKDVVSTDRVPGVIITRPMEFGVADVRKVIKDIRIRGVYDKKYVKYILLGSFDGLNWTVLRSLRGGSYKLFRMIVLTNLAPNERISWIDIDYDIRYNDKLR